MGFYLHLSVYYVLSCLLLLLHSHSSHSLLSSPYKQTWKDQEGTSNKRSKEIKRLSC